MGIVYGIVVCWMPNELCYVWNNILMWGKFHFLWNFKVVQMDNKREGKG